MSRIVTVFILVFFVGTAFAHITDDALVNAQGCRSIPAGSPPHTCHPDPEPTETIIETVNKGDGKKPGRAPMDLVLGLVTYLALTPDSDEDWLPEDLKPGFGQDPEEPPLRLLPMLNFHGEFGVKTQYELDQYHRLELEAATPVTDRNTGSVMLRFKMDPQQ